MNGSEHPAAVSRSIFTPEFLLRLHRQDEPPTAGEAELVGPWRVVPLSGGGHGVWRSGEAPDSGCGDGEITAAGEARPAPGRRPPWGRFASRQAALLTAAALPGLGRRPIFRVTPETAAEGGYGLLREGVEVGVVRHFLEDLAPAVEALEATVRSPPALALLLAAAGPTALELAGRELARLLDPPPASR